MKIKIIENTVCNGEFAEVGSTVDTDDSTATLLVALKRAEYADKKDAPKNEGGLTAKSAKGLTK